MSRRYEQFACAIAALFAVAILSCSKDASQTPAVAEERPIIVSAAASTTELLGALVEAFSANSGSKVRVNAGPSNALASQILAGAPADLFLSASQQWAEEVEKAGHAADQVRLLTNQLVLVVPQGNPGDVREPNDLLGAKVQHVAIAGEKVPAGIYAEQALRKLDLWQPLAEANKLVHGQDVRSTLSYVERGEAEAGIVYSTDAKIATGVSTVYEFAPSLHDEIVYVLVLLTHGREQPAARAFFEFLQSAEADETYRQFGFTRLH